MGESSWNSSQIQTLYALGWRAIDSSSTSLRTTGRYEGLGIDDRYSVEVIANFTYGPPIPGLNAISDFSSYALNLNFTHESDEFLRKLSSHASFHLSYTRLLL